MVYVTVKPVIDLDDHVSVSAYEFPTTVTERTRLRCVGDGAYLWTTPHGLRRLVDATGTHEVCETDAWRLEHAQELDALIQRRCDVS